MSTNRRASEHRPVVRPEVVTWQDIGRMIRRGKTFVWKWRRAVGLERVPWSSKNRPLFLLTDARRKIRERPPGRRPKAKAREEPVLTSSPQVQPERCGRAPVSALVSALLGPRPLSIMDE